MNIHVYMYMCIVHGKNVYSTKKCVVCIAHMYMYMFLRLGLLSLCVRVGYFGVWGVLTHCPSSHSWVLRHPIEFILCSRVCPIQV